MAEDSPYTRIHVARLIGAGSREIGGPSHCAEEIDDHYPTAPGQPAAMVGGGAAYQGV